VKLKIPENLTQQAYRAIRDEILNGKIDAQQHLTETFFATRYGISKSPIREALNRLESEGLITIIPRRGAFVREFSIHDVEEIYELRELLETQVVRNAVLDKKALANLREIVSTAQASLEKHDKSSYILGDAAFHTTLAKASSNLRLRKILESMHNQMQMLRRQTFELSSHNSVKQHIQILAALEKGQRDKAARLMTEHILAVRKRLVDHLKKKQEQIDE
jgi:DNA-binding GntR family transcriptional regulator